MTATLRSLLLCSPLILFVGCGYGVKVDSEGGVDAKLPGQSVKIDTDGGIEIDQGVQKMRVGKDEVEIEQPGQQVRIVNGSVDIDQGVQKLHAGKDGVEIQQPAKRVQVSRQPSQSEANPNARKIRGQD